MNLLFLTFLAPLIGYTTLAFARGRLSETKAAVIGVGSIGISALTTALLAAPYLCTSDTTERTAKAVRAYHE